MSHFKAWRQHEPGLLGIGTQPTFAIGQRALLVCTPHGNILWDCISLIDRATVELINGLGGAEGFGENALPPNDDGSSSAIDITAVFGPGGLRFFGGPYMTGYVNNNGNITFAGPLGTYTPDPFPVASRPMIAPYWADVDTRGGGRPARNGVYWHLEPGRMIVTWHNVGYYSTHDDLIMDFQLIITNALDCRSGDFDVEFRFNTCQWETGDASDVPSRRPPTRLPWTVLLRTWCPVPALRTIPYFPEVGEPPLPRTRLLTIRPLSPR